MFVNLTDVAETPAGPGAPSVVNPPTCRGRYYTVGYKNFKYGFYCISFIENLNSTLKHGPANSNLILQLFLTTTISNKLVYERLFRVFFFVFGS